MKLGGGSQVGGSSKKNQELGEQWLKDHPVESQDLLDRLTTVVIDYLSAQVSSSLFALVCSAIFILVLCSAGGGRSAHASGKVGLLSAH